MIRYSVLGRLRAELDGRELTLGTPQQRAVLALLVLRRGHLVTPEDVVAAVWGEAAPASADNLVQTYVARLRRLLEPGRPRRAPARVLVSAGRGYVLTVAPGCCDLDVFEDRLRQAGAARAAGDPEGAAGHLRAAIGVSAQGQFDLGGWDALADVPGPYAAAQRARLTEQYLVAAEDLCSAELELGRAAALVPALSGLVAAHPLRERPRALLMQALYRSGRQAEALAAYSDARAHLSRELGLEPGPELRDVQRQILAGQPLRAEPPAPAPARVPVPAQLPYGGGDLVGRSSEVEHLDRLLGDSGLIVTITGPAGVGKTALAVQWAHRHAARYPDGQLHLDLRAFTPGAEPLSTEDALAHLLRGLGVAAADIPAGLDDRAALYRTLAAGRRLVLVLDNAPDARVVRPLLPGTRSALVVITSRNRLDGLVAREGARPVLLDVLTPEAAVDVLRSVAGDQRIDAEPDAAARLADLAGRLPLALRIAGARLAAHPGRPVAELAAELDDEHRRLAALATEDGDLTVRAALDVSRSHLDAAARDLLALLGLVPGPAFSGHLAAALAGRTLAEIRPALGALVTAHLVIEAGPGRYGLHDLVRLYARALPVPGREATAHRMLDFYVDQAVRGCALLSPATSFHPLTLTYPPADPVPLDSYDDAIACLDAERENMLAAMRWAAGHGWDQHTWQLPYASFSYFKFRDFEGESVATHERALDAARRLADREAERRTLGNLSLTLTLRGEHAQAAALAGELLDIARADGDRDLEYRTRCNLGYMLRHVGRLGEAVEHLNAALDMSDVDNPAGQAHVLANLGDCHQALGAPETALALMARALRLNETIGEHREQAAVLNSIAGLHAGLGQLPEALAAYEDAARVSAELITTGQHVDALTGIGDTLASLGDPEGARSHWRRALSVLGDTNRAPAEALRARLA